MSERSRRSLWDTKEKTNKTEETTPKSPGTLRRVESPKTNSSFSDEEKDEEIDSSGNSVETELEDENNSGKTYRRKGKQTRGDKGTLYPPLEAEIARANNEDAKRRNVASERRCRDPELDENVKARRNEDVGSNNWIVAVVFLVVVVIILSKDKFCSNKEPVGEKPKSDQFVLFKQEFDSLKKQFPEQSDRFWKVIGAPIKRVMTEEQPIYPAIVLLGVPQSQSHMGSCLTKKIVQRINTIQRLSGDFYIDMATLDNSSPAKTKLDLDRKLHSALNSSRTVILDGIDLLPSQAALLLHAFCDGDNAPYKKAVIFLVLHLSSEFSDPPKENVVEEILMDLWKSELGDDEMPALLSRIANNIATMKPEKSAVCK